MENSNDKTEIILAQWQTCVEMANSVSQRRDTMNNIFITLNLAILATVSLSWDIKSVFILIAGIVICYIWMLLIQNYKLLNAAKFVVINKIEEKLCIAPFKDEWEILKKDKEYKDTTKLEKYLPITFTILYVIMIITIIVIKVIS